MLDADALVSAGKEMVRVMILAVIPVLIDSFQKGAVDYRVVAVVAVIAGLRFIEKYLYKVESKNPVTNLMKFE